MRRSAFIAGVALLSGLTGPAAVAAPLPSDAVVVQFKEPVGDRFVGFFHEMMGTETLAKQSPTRYTFRIGRRGNQNDYAVLLAHLPYVREVEPLPRLSAADRGMPEGVVAIGLDQRAAPDRLATRPPEDNGGPGIYLSPDRLLGHHLLVRYRGGGPIPALVNQIYGTRMVERTDADEVRVTLPPRVNPLLASRMFRLCPYVMSAEPAYGR